MRGDFTRIGGDTLATWRGVDMHLKAEFTGIIDLKGINLDFIGQCSMAPAAQAQAPQPCDYPSPMSRTHRYSNGIMTSNPGMMAPASIEL
jgi:hypothetical protein